MNNYPQYRDKVVTYKQFVDFEMDEQISNSLKLRMANQSAGHCCCLVYTSGTTGNPKGVMLSHDNYTWLATNVSTRLKFDHPSPRQVSFLPLSHVAAQYADLIQQLGIGTHVFFADAMALKGTLVDYLLDVRPHIMVAVPRLYEKMEDKVRLALEQKPKIMKWALEVIFF